MFTGRNSVWGKVVSVVVVFMFLIGNPIYVVPAAQAAKTVPTVSAVADVSIPSHIGTITDSYTAPGSDKLVIHIQDAHVNYSAQKNISGILENIVDNNNVGLIGIEGCQRWYGDAETKAEYEVTKSDEWLDNQLRDGYISGTDYYISKKPEITHVSFGYESKDLLKSNHTAYLAMQESGSKALPLVANVKNGLSDLKSHILSEDLLSLIQKRDAYDARTVSFSQYLSDIADIAKKQGVSMDAYSNIVRAVESATMEDAIDFAKVNDERTELINDLSKTLPKEDLQEMVTASLHFRTGKIDSLKYYSYLETILPKERKSDNLRNYITYVKANAKLDSSALSDEREALEDALIAKLAKTEDEKQMLANLENVDIFEKLLSIKLVREEFVSFQAVDFSLQSLLSFINEKSAKFNTGFAWNGQPADWTKAHTDAVSFYKSAVNRENAFVKNLLAQMKVDKANTSTLISGGFHTAQIAKDLRDAGVSYVVVRPRVTEATPKGIYTARMKEAIASHMNKNTLPAQPAEESEAVSSAPDGKTAGKEFQARVNDLKALKTAGKLTDASLAAVEGQGTNAKLVYEAMLAVFSDVKDAEGNPILVESLGDDFVGSAIAHFNVNNGKVEFNENALRFIARMAVLEKLTLDEAVAHAEIILAHELKHKAEPGLSEAGVVTYEGSQYTAKEARLSKEARKKLAAGYVKAGDKAYADFLNSDLDAAAAAALVKARVLADKIEEAAKTAAVLVNTEFSEVNGTAVDYEDLLTLYGMNIASIAAVRGLKGGVSAAIVKIVEEIQKLPAQQFNFSTLSAALAGISIAGVKLEALALDSEEGLRIALKNDDASKAAAHADDTDALARLEATSEVSGAMLQTYEAIASQVGAKNDVIALQLDAENIEGFLDPEAKGIQDSWQATIAALTALKNKDDKQAVVVEFVGNKKKEGEAAYAKFAQIDKGAKPNKSILLSSVTKEQKEPGAYLPIPKGQPVDARVALLAVAVRSNDAFWGTSWDASKLGRAEATYRGLYTDAGNAVTVGKIHTAPWDLGAAVQFIDTMFGSGAYLSESADDFRANGLMA